MDLTHILKQAQKPAKTQKRTRSPESSDDMSPKKIKHIAGFLADMSSTQENLSPTDSITSPGSSEKRTDESSESPSTPRKNKFKPRGGSTALEHANTMVVNRVKAHIILRETGQGQLATELENNQGLQQIPDESRVPSTPRRKLFHRREGSVEEGHLNPAMELLRTIRKNYKMLKAKMEPTEIAHKLFEKGIIDKKSIQTLQNGIDRQMKNELLMKEMFLIRQGNIDNICHDMFFSILRETGQGKIATELEKSQCQTHAPEKLPHERNDLMNFIITMEDTLLEEVEPNVMFDEIFTIGGLGLKELEELRMEKKRRQRIQFLLDMIKSAEQTIADKIINLLIDTYPDLYEAFKKGNKGNRSKQIAATAVNDYQLDSVGTPLTMTLKISAGATSAVQDTTEHNDPLTVIRKTRKEVEEIERRIVNNIDENPDQLGALLESCIARFEGVKLSCIKVFIKSLSKDSLERLMLYSSSKAAKTLLLSLIDDDAKEKLANMKAKLVIDISKGCNDIMVRATFEKECFCHLKKETITRHFSVLVEGMNVSKIAITRILKSYIIGEKTRSSMMEIYAIKDRLERNGAFLNFLIRNGFPDACLCILEEEVVKHGGSDIICAMIKELSGSEESQHFEITKKDIRKYIELLKEELEPRSFMRRLRKREDQESKELLKVILTSESRDERIGPFLEYLFRQNDFTWFLEEIGMTNKQLYETLVSRNASNNPNNCSVLDFRKMQIATQYFFDDVIEEVEPLILSKTLQRNSQQELNISKLESIPERAKRASGFFLTLLSVSESTFVDTMNAMTSCGYKDIVDSIKALVREGPLNDRYRCPHVLCIEECREKIVYTETFTFDERSAEGTNIPSSSIVRNREVDTEDIDIDISSECGAEYTVAKPQIKNSQGDKTSSRSSVIKLSRKRRALSVRGSESGVFSGSGACSEEFNTDEDSECEDSSSEVERRKMTAEWIKGQSPLVPVVTDTQSLPPPSAYIPQNI